LIDLVNSILSSADEQKQRRRQKIMENRTKRQTQEVFTADSTGIQSDLGNMKGVGSQSLQDASGMISPNGESSSPIDGSSGVLGNWANHPMASTQDPMTAGMAVGPKRDIWESMGKPPVSDDAKRQAFDAIQAGMAQLPGARNKNGFDDEVNLVSSTNPAEDHGRSCTSGSPTDRSAKPVATYTPTSQVSPTSTLSANQQDPALALVTQYNSMIAQTTAASQPPTVTNQDAEKASPKAEAPYDIDINSDLLKAMTEPCFFNLKPPSLASKAYSALEPHIQHRLVICVEAYREFCRPMVSIHGDLNPQDYVSLLNSGEECYRQLVRFAKRLPEFRALSQDDQISLLKGNVIEIMIVRFSKCYNLETNAWTFPHCGSMQNISGMIEDHMISDFCLEDYSNFVRAALHCCQDDDLILVVLQVITLFWPHVPNLEDHASIEAAHKKYVGALESYLNVMYADNNMVVMVNKVMEQLRNVGKKAHDVMWKSQVSDLHPLLKEMFDLR
jgi:hypothetical protein